MTFPRLPQATTAPGRTRRSSRANPPPRSATRSRSGRTTLPRAPSSGRSTCVGPHSWGRSSRRTPCRPVCRSRSRTTAEPRGTSTRSAAPRTIETAGDRGYYAAPAISPNGTDVYVVYNAFTTPYHANTSSPNMLVGVVKHADVGGSGTGAFSQLHRGTPGDARGSSANALSAEFLGDYVYAAATRTYGAAV